MKIFFLMFTLLLSNLSFAGTLPSFIKSLEGNYTGEFGILNVRSCNVQVKLVGKGKDFHKKFVMIEVVREDDIASSIKLNPGLFRLNSENEMTDHNLYYFKFSPDGELLTASILRKHSVLRLKKITCRRLVKLD